MEVAVGERSLSRPIWWMRWRLRTSEPPRRDRRVRVEQRLQILGGAVLDRLHDLLRQRVVRAQQAHTGG
jgi:hypothetical protein